MKELIKLGVTNGKDNRNRMKICIHAMTISMIVLILLHGFEVGIERVLANILDRPQDTPGVSGQVFHRMKEDYQMMFMFLKSIGMVMLIVSYVNMFSIMLSKGFEQKEWFGKMSSEGYKQKDIIVISAMEMAFQGVVGIILASGIGFIGGIIIDIILRSSYATISSISWGAFVLSPLLILIFAVISMIVCMAIGGLTGYIITRQNNCYKAVRYVDY